jgi:polyphenol oxidase
MILHEIDNVEFLSFKHFDKTNLVNHCFSTKVGGVSVGMYASMNFGLGRGDDINHVICNFERLGNAVGFDYKDIVSSSQTHSTNCLNVVEKYRGNGILFKNEFEDIDGLITNTKGPVLMTFAADCATLYFLDTVKKVIAISHSGWKGTVNNMVKATIDEMVKLYNCEPKNILAGIGPSIGKCCFEVKTDVADLYYGLPYASEHIQNNGDGKYYIDLWSILKKQMTKCGIKSCNIEVTDLCTKCRTDLFYSHRLSGNERGTMAGFIQLKDSDMKK